MFFIPELFSECIQSQVWYNSQGIQKITLLKHFYKHGNPGNIYTQDELGTALTRHFKIRNLTPDLKQGFLGACWLELKDAAKSIRIVNTLMGS